MKIRTSFILLTLTMLAFSSITFADEPGPEPTYTRRPASAPVQPAPPPPPVQPFTVYQSRGVTPPPPPPIRRIAQAPVPIQDYDFFTVGADFLLWTNTEDNLGWIVNCPAGGNAIANGCNTINLSPGWKGGFRIFGGYTWSPDMWDIKGRWTWFLNKEFDSQTSGTLFPLWTHPDQDGTAISGTAFWQLQFNSIDVEFGKTFKPGQFFTLRPFTGVKGAIVDQNMNANYVGTGVTDSPLGRGITMSNDFGGIGLRSGFDSAWDLGSGFSIIGKASGSILWGRFKVHYLSLGADPSPATTTIANVRDQFNSTKAVLEAALGLNYHTAELLGDDYPLDFYVMYEDQEWFGQNQIMRFFGRSPDDGMFIHEKGDLAFHGVTFGAAISF